MWRFYPVFCKNSNHWKSLNDGSFALSRINRLQGSLMTNVMKKKCVSQQPVNARLAQLTIIGKASMMEVSLYPF
ncbi:hypothetical protein B8W99_25805 [Peribacillus simplex]|nr:hypothetical protein B8W99_25805 [Peribacillus simplex]